MENLIADIEAFCRLHGMAESQFGLLSLKDKNFIAQLRGGRDLRLSTVARVRRFMSEYGADLAA